MKKNIFNLYLIYKIMSRKKFKNRREVIKFYSPEGNELKFGDKLIFKERRMTPYGMDNIIFTVVITKDNVKDLISKGIIVQKREEKGWKPSEALQATINKFTKEADTYDCYFTFLFLLKLIKNEMYGTGTNSNEGCEYGLSLTGKIGKFTAPIANGYPLFKSQEDVQKAIKPILTLYKMVYTGMYTV